MLLEVVAPLGILGDFLVSDRCRARVPDRYRGRRRSFVKARPNQFFGMIITVRIATAPDWRQPVLGLSGWLQSLSGTDVPLRHESSHFPRRLLN